MLDFQGMIDLIQKTVKDGGPQIMNALIDAFGRKQAKIAFSLLVDEAHRGVLGPPQRGRQEARPLPREPGEGRRLPPQGGRDARAGGPALRFHLLGSTLNSFFSDLPPFL